MCATAARSPTSTDTSLTEPCCPCADSATAAPPTCGAFRPAPPATNAPSCPAATPPAPPKKPSTAPAASTSTTPPPGWPNNPRRTYETDHLVALILLVGTSHRRRG